MKIGINASFARKENTGIGQVTINFLKKLMEFPLSKHQFPNKSQIQNFKYQKHEFFIYLEEDLFEDFKLPENFTKRVFLPLWKRDDLLRKIWWEKCLLPKRAKKDGCDVFVSLYQSATVMPRRIKHLMLVNDIIPKLFPEYLNNSRKKLYWKLTEKAIKKAGKIIAISRRTEKDLVQKLAIDPGKISVAYLDVDGIYKKEISQDHSLKILKKYNLKPGYIYNSGGLEVRKNIENLILAYKHLVETNKTLHFVKEIPQLVISGKLMPQLAPLVTDAEKLIKELNLTGHVRMLDFVPQEDMPALYKNALLFAYPSVYEGFGLPVLEAMNQGIPVVASKTSSLPEVGGDSILYCDPSDPKDIAMTIKNLLLNKELHETLARKSKERAENFSWDKFTDKILNIINERNF